MKIAINNFVTRQTADSRFSHFAGSFEELASLVEANFSKAEPGYKDGVLRIPVPAEGFFSGVIHLTPETELVARFQPRRQGEDPYVVVTARGEKAPAAVVEIIVYRHDVLAANNDNSTVDEWEIVSINARDTQEPEPQHPVSMARNVLGLAGGSSASYTAEEFAKSIVYWSTRAMVEPPAA
ncbi:MAG: DUF3228 family protein [Candidatus Pacebacteria bacterium]|nr:DUF3228 family protein [Candidatus Paceibacterota bacterium]